MRQNTPQDAPPDRDKSKFGGGKESDRMRAHDYEIKTERLLLRPMTVADADAVWKWVSDERVAKYMVYPTYTDKEKLREWLRSIEEFDGEYLFGYVRLSDNELIGSGSIGPRTQKEGVWGLLEKGICNRSCKSDDRFC